MADEAHRARMESGAVALEAERRQEFAGPLQQAAAGTRERARVRTAEKASGKEVERASGKEIERASGKEVGRGLGFGSPAANDIFRLASGLGGHLVVAMISPVSPIGSARAFMAPGGSAQVAPPSGAIPRLVEQAKVDLTPPQLPAARITTTAVARYVAPRKRVGAGAAKRKRPKA